MYALQRATGCVGCVGLTVLVVPEVPVMAVWVGFAVYEFSDTFW